MKHRKLFLFVGFVALVTIIGSVFVVLTTNRDAFDASVWKEQRGNYEHYNPRIRMTTSLRERHLRKGMARTDVHALLGTPDQETDTTDTYYLGRSQVSVKFAIFVLSYDDENRLIDFTNRRH
jgi:outer membrane protein assembly factor BamE (lipoprotein component of BamABCDE complex)